MNNMKTIFCIILSTFLLSVSSANYGKDDCNLLESYSEQHKYLEFVGCEKGKGEQNIKEATYRVKAKNSIEVEAYLVDKYGMGKLKFTCCGWEPEKGVNGEIENKELKEINENYSLIITMYGNAEKKDSNGSLYIEKDRNKINYFYVTVSLLEI